MLGQTGLGWVAVEELKLSYHNGYIGFRVTRMGIYIVNNRVSPI